MDPVHSDLSQRFARSCTTAAFGYARAASAAYAAFANQTLDFWTRAAQGAHGGEATHWVSGPRPYRSAVTEARPLHATPSAMDFGFGPAWAGNPFVASFRAWWGLFPLEGNPASWPMAYAMMTAGVPRAVALPAAEANMAAMDAAEAASASIDRTFSAYRSENGFAVSQIVSPKTLMSTLLFAPFAALPKLPWG